MDDCDRAVAFEPKDPNAYLCRSLTYLHMGDPARAIAACDRAIELNPKMPGLYRPCAMAQLQAGSPARSIAYFDRSKEFDPKDPYTAIWRRLQAGAPMRRARCRRRLKKLDMTKWPAPVVQLLLGTMTPDKALSAADEEEGPGLRGEFLHCRTRFAARRERGRSAVFWSRSSRLPADFHGITSGRGGTQGAGCESLSPIHWHVSCNSMRPENVVASILLSGREGLARHNG